MSFGLYFCSFIRYIILPIIVRLLPEPAPAITKDDLESDRTTLL
jgi:hypothetical protein